MTSGRDAEPWQWGQRAADTCLGLGNSSLNQEVLSQHIAKLRAAWAQHTQALPFWLSQCSISPLTSDPFLDLTLTDQEYFDFAFSFLCLFFFRNIVMKLFLSLSSLFTVFFSEVVSFMIFLCRTTNGKSIGVLNSGQNWLHFVNIGRIRFALKPTASKKSHSALCVVQVTGALLSTAGKAFPGKNKAAGLWYRRNFLIIYSTMMRHRIQTGLYISSWLFICNEGQNQSPTLSHCLCFAVNTI